MKRLLLFLTLLASSVSVTAEVDRDAILAIPAGPLEFDEAPLSDVLKAAAKTAGSHGVGMRVEDLVTQAAGKVPVTLHATGLTLDALLEYVTRMAGAEWKLEGGVIVVFTTRQMLASQVQWTKSPVRQRLDALTIPEISFNGVDMLTAFQMVREAAVKRHGLGAVPKLELPGGMTVVRKVSFTAEKASVLDLFDLLASASVSSVEWRLQGTRIVLTDEAERRRVASLRRRQPLTLGGESAADPFSAPSPAAPLGPIMRQPPGALPSQVPDFNTESYDHFGDNPFRSPVQDPLSTFSVDVDTASYSNIRRMILSRARIPLDAARIEEMVNYFPYDYAPPAAGPADDLSQFPPFATHLEVAAAPWAPDHRLVRIGLKGYEIEWKSRPPSNLVFLLDVSGSMDSPDKIGLVKGAMERLVRKLGERDTISIVVYAGASGLALPATAGSKRNRILKAIGSLQADGSTNAGEGIELAYATARENFLKHGNNRVILCTDGDFNVGITDRGSLVGVVEKQAKAGVFLTVLGFGMGNYKDGMLETLSNKGNGNYAYIDSEREARKVFEHDLTGTLVTIAKDVKVQVEFNPAKVGAYRLLGYENRLLEAEDFDDDTKDAGEIGAGHTVTAFYEIVPRGREEKILRAVAPLKYQKVESKPVDPEAAGELLTLKLRYKEPKGEQSKLLTQPLVDPGDGLEKASGDFRFAAAVACFGMTLRDSDYRGKASCDLALELARPVVGEDPEGYRAEFVRLVELYQARSK